MCHFPTNFCHLALFLYHLRTLCIYLIIVRQTNINYESNDIIIIHFYIIFQQTYIIIFFISSASKLDLHLSTTPIHQSTSLHPLATPAPPHHYITFPHPSKLTTLAPSTSENRRIANTNNQRPTSTRARRRWLDFRDLPSKHENQ